MIKEADTSVTADQLREVLSGGERAQLIDVRPYPDFAGRHIEGSVCVPLSSLEKKAAEIDRSRPVYLICRKGIAAQRAEARLKTLQVGDTHVLEGGIDSWSEAGFPVVKKPVTTWSLERQVRLTGGSIVLLGVALGWAVHPAFLLLSAFIAAGLVYSAISDSCGMALMLCKLPWNRAPE